MPDRTRTTTSTLARHVRVAASLVAAPVVLAACANAGSPDTGRPDGPPSAPAAVSVVSTALPGTGSQVQAMAVTPSRDVLAATSGGLYSVSGSGSQRIGSLTDDVDGLAVAGDDIYVSAHRESDGDGSGLLRSADGGRTWTTISGPGSADLDDLAVRGSTIVAADKGRLWISTDAGTSWRRSRDVDAVSLTLDSHDLWLTGARGLQRARADATQVEPIPDAPGLYRGGLGADGSVWGIEQDGDVWLRDDHGRWREVYRLPAGTVVTAFTPVDASRAVVATDRALEWITVNDRDRLPMLAFA